MKLCSIVHEKIKQIEALLSIVSTVSEDRIMGDQENSASLYGCDIVRRQLIQLSHLC